MRQNEKEKSYSAWSSMIQRCTNPKNGTFKYHGARGITVCDEWKSFKNFYADMGDSPKGKSLDRIDNEKGYYPGNCRWATHIQQMRNRRYNHNLLFNGLNLPISEWAERLGFKKNILYERLSRGWSIAETLMKKPRAYEKIKPA